MADNADTLEITTHYDAFGRPIATIPATPEAGVPTGTLTADAAMIEDGGDEETYGLWKDRADQGISPYDASIFAKELTEDDLVANASWQAAAKTLYDDRNGEGAWDRKVAEEGWSPEEAAIKLGEEGIDRIANFNYQLLETGRTAWEIGGKPPEVQMAMLYMMEAFDHKNMTWGGTARAAWKTVTDPVNAAMIVGGIVGSFFTFGGTGAAAAAGVAARQAATQAGKMAFMATLRSQIGKTIATVTLEQARTRLAEKVVASSVAKNVIVQKTVLPFVSRQAVHAGTVGMVEGGIWGVATDAMIQNTELSGYDALGIERNFSFARSLTSGVVGVGMGLGMGHAFSGGFNLLGKGTRSLVQKFSRTTPRVAEAPVTAKVDGRMGEGPFSPFARFAADESGAVKMPFMSRSATPSSFPKFSPGLDKIKVAAHLNVFKWFPAKSMRPRSFGITRPVIRSLDDKMVELGLAGRLNGRDIEPGALQKLQNELLGTLDSGANPKAIIDSFRDRNAPQLRRFKEYAHELHEHIKTTYQTNAERRAKRNPRTGELELGGDHTGWLHDLTTEQKKALLTYVKDMETFADDLLKGSDGQMGAEMLASLEKIANGQWDAPDIKNSVTGLSRANLISNNAQIRTTGQWLNGSPAFQQWVKGLERSIDVGVYDTNPHAGDPLTFGFLSQDNLERTWQNHVLDKFAERDENGNLKVDFTTNVEAKGMFVSRLMPFIDSGYGHEAVLSMEQLARLAQVKGKGDQLPFPSSTQFKRALAESKIDMSNPTNKLYLDAVLKIIEREEKAGKGAADVTFTGIKERFFEDNRPNRHRAESQTYFWEYANRWSGHEGSWWSFGNPVAKPANITVNQRVKYYPNAIVKYFLGAKEVKPGTKNVFGVERKDYGNPEITWKDTDKEETWISVGRRSLVRISTSGLVDDIPSLKPWKWRLSKPGFYTVGIGAGLFAAGTGLEHTLGDDYYLKDIGRVPLNIGLGSANFIADHTWGYIPYVPDVPYELAIDYINHEDITEGEALHALEGYEVVDGHVVPITRGPGHRSLRTHWAASVLAKKLADEDTELTQENIQSVFTALTQGVAPPGQQQTPPPGGQQTPPPGQQQTPPPGGQQVPPPGQQQTPPPGGQQTPPPGQQQTPPPGGQRVPPYTNTSNTGTQDWLNAGGNMVSGVFSDAFDWDNDGSADGVFGEFGTFLSGMFGAVGGFISKMASGRIAGGEKYLAGGIGIIAGLLGTNILKSLIPGADKIPFLGIVLFALIAGFGGKLSFSALTGQTSAAQGPGRFRPSGTPPPQINHDDPVVRQPAPPAPIVVAEDTPGEGSRVIALDPDANGKWAPQLSMKDGRTFAPANLIPVMGRDEVAQAVTKAKASNTFIPTAYLPPVADQADEWEAQAVDHTGNDKVIAFRVTGNRTANDPEYLVLDIAN